MGIHAFHKISLRFLMCAVVYPAILGPGFLVLVYIQEPYACAQNLAIEPRGDPMFGVPSTHTVVRVDDLCMTPVEAVYVVPRSEVANCRFFARGRTEA